MDVFRNNYKRLVQENKYEMAEMAKMSVRNFRELNSMMEYMETYNLSLFELEVVKKDRIVQPSDRFSNRSICHVRAVSGFWIFRICYTGNRERDLFYPVSAVHCRRYRE